MEKATINLHPTKEEFMEMLEKVANAPRDLKYHAPQAAMIAMSDAEFIEVWNNGGETEYMIFDQPCGREMANKITERAKKLNLIT